MSRPGDSVGSRLRDASIAGLDPVTTDRPSGREIAIPVEIARQQRAESANLRTRSDAGPLQNTGQYLAPYISGYADGEGCFTVSIAPREKILVRWEVRPSFSVSQNRDRAEVLLLLEDYFGCGSIRPDRSDRTLKWETRRLEDLLERVIPHFERYPLLSSKRLDFEALASICRMMERGAHLSRDGLRDIARLAHSMNVGGKRRYALKEILGRTGRVKE
jgi:LAGLIDADG endonuclease